MNPKPKHLQSILRKSKMPNPSIIMTIQAEGDKMRAQKLLDTYAHNTEIITDALNRIQNIPTDITPIYK